MADGLERLLRLVIDQEILRIEQKNVQLTAGPRVSGETVDANQQIERDREHQRAHDLGPSFASGLRLAYAAQQAGHGNLVLDDREPAENAAADALVQFLVRPQLATSQSEATAPNHYRYQFNIDWARLQALADAAGIDLQRELTQRD